MNIPTNFPFSLKIAWWLAYDEAVREDRPVYWIDNHMKCFGVERV